MSDLVHQLGELFLRAVPVAVIVLLFYIIMRSIFFQPLLRVMAERDARTIGAQKAAEAAQAHCGLLLPCLRVLAEQLRACAPQVSALLSTLAEDKAEAGCTSSP